MRTIELTRLMTGEQATALVGDKVPMLEPTDIAPGTIVRDADTGNPVLMYARLADAGPLRRAMLRVNCSGGVQRQTNYRSRSRTFGYAPRRPVVRREACGLTSLCSEQPDIARLLEGYADELSTILTDNLPEIAERGSRELGDVLPDWRLGHAKLWTSGVINDTAALPYHRDGFNFPVWSAMPVLRRGTRGGYLHLPEYGVALPCADGTVAFFEGFRWVHGVTPITWVKGTDRSAGYRISVVYYALRGMKNCREAAEETAYGRRKRTEREADMAKRLAAGDRSIPGNVDPRGAVARMQGSMPSGGVTEHVIREVTP